MARTWVAVKSWTFCLKVVEWQHLTTAFGQFRFGVKGVSIKQGGVSFCKNWNPTKDQIEDYKNNMDTLIGNRKPKSLTQFHEVLVASGGHIRNK